MNNNLWSLYMSKIQKIECLECVESLVETLNNFLEVDRKTITEMLMKKYKFEVQSDDSNIQETINILFRDGISMLSILNYSFYSKSGKMIVAYTYEDTGEIDHLSYEEVSLEELC
jgi:predicted transcriptional regulator